LTTAIDSGNHRHHFQMWSLSNPFPKIRDIGIVMHVLRGNRPPRPTVDTGYFRDMPESTWGLTQRCWAQIPGERAKVSDIVQTLDHIIHT
jgi:hypothetical protein